MSATSVFADNPLIMALMGRLAIDSITYTRAFGDGPRNFEPWSGDVDDTSADILSPNYHTTPSGGRFSSRQI
ncbi:hypothetical protein TNCV_315351 [Trichonephila clavipes]|nr:hypothetical protein TNCV_315351 [Trichonephila clavipes]